MQEPSTSSGMSLKTSQSAGTEPRIRPSDTPSGQYDPEVYKCVDFDKGYVYFDGKPGSDHDQRFTIDLEHGTMDRLPDVRPYLYYVGYHSSRRMNIQGKIESLEPLEIEQAHVVAGRQYLTKEWKQGRGYFLKARNWGSLNTGSYTCFPFQRLVGSDNEADQGFEFAHDMIFPNMSMIAASALSRPMFGYHYHQVNWCGYDLEMINGICSFNGCIDQVSTGP